MRKGEATREAVIGLALSHAAEVGLNGVTLGVLAGRARLSKSGLFAHFRSKEALQLAVLEEAIRRFGEAVVAPALARPRGEPRLAALFRNYLVWIRGNKGGTGCIFQSLSEEYDDRPGPVRDRLVRALSDWRAALARATAQAVEEGHFRAGVEPDQVAYELVGIAKVYHESYKLLADPGAQDRAQRAFERLLAEARAAPARRRR
ncbi:MAG: TetR/AcrR family transcriptional regulator [Deltaproteobacteria bacterium]|nr:TetR/AcrR family transcriptional regulator [Deltaproteobacteria bacterium]